MPAGPTADRVDAIRRFNRFYTRRIGVLGRRLVDTRFSLTEARVLFELAHAEGLTATDLARDLGIDAGQMSRTLGGFEEHGLVRRVPAPDDGRRRLLSLTGKGRRAFRSLDTRTRAQVEQMVSGLSGEQQGSVIRAMATIQDLLQPAPDPAPPIVIREPRAGDLGWVMQRHGAIYWEEYGWNEEFEGLIAEILARYVAKRKPDRERGWIAEQRGVNVGSVFLMEHSPSVAQLRLLLVEPAARGHGLGTRLVDECLAFARGAGYRKMRLWTNRLLLPARHIYRKTGFRHLRSEPHRAYGHDQVGEVWERKL